MIEVLAAFLLSYWWHGTGITVGYHRLLSHRSFRCKKAFEYFFVAGGYLAYQGSPIWWSSIHRAHHKYSDTPLDPHSPKVHGIKHALVGWMLGGKYPEHIQADVYCPDLVKDPIYRVLECGGSPARASLVNLIINIIYRGGLWLLLGWQVAVASLVASLMVFLVPQMLNVICHMPKLGYRNFGTNEDSVNVWWVGLLGLGEGWHNNHHAFPGCPQSGLRWFELDVSWLTIKLGKALGLVTTANVPKAFLQKLATRKGALLRLERFRAIRRARPVTAA
jgi:stearoyl-CoA desaturase (delta-9 desaturase)